MADIPGYADLDQPYKDLISRWVDELNVEMPRVMLWWNRLQKQSRGSDSDSLRFRWPSGPVSHPRIIALYRKYYFEVQAVNDELEEVESDKDRELHWSIDEDKSDDSAAPVPANTILLEMMKDYAPELFEYFRLFVYIPIGENQDLEPC